MGISQSVALWLKIQGHDSVHLNDEGLFKLADIFILEKAIKENRIIITSEMDFGQLLAFNRAKQTSVIQFRTSTFTPHVVKEKPGLLFENFSPQMDQPFMITIEDNRIRHRYLPF